MNVTAERSRPSPGPPVSVLMPAHDAVDTLAACLDSIQAQSLTDFELLLMDDGSTDGTAALADARARLPSIQPGAEE